MKKLLFPTLLLTITLTGCDNQPEGMPSSHNPDPAITAQFEKSDKIIGSYLDQLDSSNTTLEEKTRILCKDYPNEYKTNYMLALIKLAGNEYTEAKLLSDLNIELDYYKKKDNLQC